MCCSICCIVQLIICNCLSAVVCGQSSGATHTTHFMLSEGVYATADIPPTDSVLLWLGVGCVGLVWVF